MSLAPSTLVTRNSTAVNSAVTPIMTAYRIPQENLETEITGKTFRYFYFNLSPETPDNGIDTFPTFMRSKSLLL